MARTIEGRLHIAFPRALDIAKVDGWRLLEWMHQGDVEWAYDQRGIVWIELASLWVANGAPAAARAVLP